MKFNFPLHAPFFFNFLIILRGEPLYITRLFFYLVNSSRPRLVASRPRIVAAFFHQNILIIAAATIRVNTVYEIFGEITIVERANNLSAIKTLV